jgi:hypothetical protein
MASSKAVLSGAICLLLFGIMSYKTPIIYSDEYLYSSGKLHKPATTGEAASLLLRSTQQRVNPDDGFFAF